MPAAVDYYELDALLTEDERITRDTIRAFVQNECLPVLEGCFSREEFPRHLVPRMGELGMFGANLHGYG